MKLQLLNMATHTLDALLVYYFLIKLFNKKNVVKNWGIYLIILMAINYLIGSVFGNGEILSLVLILIASSFVYSYLLDEEIFKTLGSTVLATITMSTVEIITIIVMVLILNVQPSVILGTKIYEILGIVLSKALFFLVIKYLLRKVKILAYFKGKNYKIIVLILVYNMFVIFMLVHLYRYIEVTSIREIIYLISIGIGIILFSFTIYAVTSKSIYQNQQGLVWKLKEEEFYKNDFYIKSMRDILETIKSQRHDLNNYLSTIYGLIYLERFEDAKRYIGEINDQINNLNVIIDTNHPIITALVSIKKNKAFDNDIDIDLDLDIEFPEDMDFEFIDLSIVIGNLLDNAIEACQLIAEDRTRKIEFIMYTKGGLLKIGVKNTKVKSKKVDMKSITGRFTTKDNSEDHGYGLGNIEFVVKQYNGNMEILNLEDEFIVNIDLPIKEHNKSTA